MTHSASDNFLSFSGLKLRQFCGRIESCLALLNEEQIWTRWNESSNSVGNLLLHLQGNVRQWILHGVGGQPDMRHRDEEFAARGEISKTEAWSALEAAVQEAADLIESLSAVALTRTIRPQNYEVTVLEAIYHVVEHFAQHTGQIIWITKALSGEDLGFYKHLSGTRQPPPPPSGGLKP